MMDKPLTAPDRDDLEPLLQAEQVGMDAPERFINREISWLGFNERVLAEAQREQHPLLERLRFVAISATNLEEFIMVRFAGLKAQVRARMETLSPEGLTSAQQVAMTAARAAEAGRPQSRTNPHTTGKADTARHLDRTPAHRNSHTQPARTKPT